MERPSIIVRHASRTLGARVYSNNNSKFLIQKHMTSRVHFKGHFEDLKTVQNRGCRTWTSQKDGEGEVRRCSRRASTRQACTGLLWQGASLHRLAVARGWLVPSCLLVLHIRPVFGYAVLLVGPTNSLHFHCKSGPRAVLFSGPESGQHNGGHTPEGPLLD